MAEDAQGEISRLLGEIERGDGDARESLVALVGKELHRMARGILARERANHTLQPTALVHEAYLKLFLARPLKTHDRAFFFASAARAMRQVLVDYARRIKARPEGNRVEFLDAVSDAVKSTHRVEVLDLHMALEELEEIHCRQAAVASLRFFGGLRWKEIAAYLEVSTSTVEKDWQLARAWLFRRLEGERA